MNMKFYTVLFMVFIGVMTFGGCTNDTMASSDSSSANGTAPSKITSLQAAVDLARSGDTIDASQYTNITQYEANINKAVTIQNFSNLDGKTLTVSADGVVLSNIGNVGVTTNSSLKISGSSLSSLSIAQSSAQQSLYCGRGDSARTRPPKVELLSSSVSYGVNINIENAALTVNDITTDKIKFNANGTQLTIEDSSSNIGRIETDKICQVVLEDGTSDTIPCSKDKIDVTDDGKLTQINMQAAESLILTKLSPESGLVTTMKEDESIDFSKLEVMGTYMASGAVTVYTAKITYTLQSTYTQLEENFTIKIDGNPAYIRTNRVGQYVTGFNWSSLAPGYHQASIESDFGNLGSEYKYNFEITVYEATLTPELIGIEADLRYVRSTNNYLADETLDLSGLKILGEYQVVSSLSGTTTYKEEIEDYNLSIADGTVLTSDMTAVIVSYQNLDTTIPIKVYPSCRVTLYYGYKTESYLIKNPTSIAEPEVNRPGYWQGKFNSSPTRYTDYNVWHTTESPSDNDNTVNFPYTITGDITLYAHWAKYEPNVGDIVYLDPTSADEENDRYIFVKTLLPDRTPIGVVYTAANGAGKMIWFEEESRMWCSLSSAANICEYYQKKKTSVDDGSYNIDIIKQYFGSNYSNSLFYGFYYCDSIDCSDNPQNPWYMPAKNELTEIFQNRSSLNNTLSFLKQSGLTNVIELDTSKHWSSTDKEDLAYAIGISLGTISTSTPDKGKTHIVRPIRKFKYTESVTPGNMYKYQE